MKYKAREVYQDEATAGLYDKKRFSSFRGMLTDRLEKSLINKALACAGVDPPASILDIPCGTGRLLVYLAVKGYKTRGADISAAMIEQTKKKLAKENLAEKVTAETGDAESLSFPDSSFDACVSLRLLGHTPPPVRIRILKELKRVSGKCLILAYYHKNCLQYLLRKRGRAARGNEWHPVDFKQIDDELRAAGLERIKLLPLFEGISETVIVAAKKAEVEDPFDK